MRNKTTLRALFIILLALVVSCSSERSGIAASDIQSRIEDMGRKMDIWMAAGNDYAAIEQLEDKLNHYVEIGENDKADKVINEILQFISKNDVNQTKDDTKSDDIQPVTDDKNIAIAKTTGVYTCISCSKAHEWYIGEDHVLYWEGKPYIPHAMTGLESFLDGTKKKADKYISMGITDFIIQ